MAQARRAVSKRGMVRIHVEIPVVLISQFERLYPHYGQLTTFIRKCLEKHLADVMKDTSRLLDE